MEEMWENFVSKMPKVSRSPLILVGWLFIAKIVPRYSFWTVGFELDKESLLTVVLS